MMLSWMLYVLVVGALVALAAWAAAEVGRLWEMPTRWSWAAALLLTLALAGWAPARQTGTGLTMPGVVQVEAGGGAEAAGAPLASRLAGSLRRALRTVTAAPLRVAAGEAGGREWDRGLAAGWMGMSALVLAALAATGRRYRLRRRGFAPASLLGTEVRVSDGWGPAVVGVVRPEIVVPRWLLHAPLEEQRLVMAHEVEHRRARDPLLLALGCAATVLLPWHPAVWWVAARLRLATEMDCDARVLRRGVQPLAYGSLLIAVAGRASGLPSGGPALADSSSHLERRLIAMSSAKRRFVLARAGALGTLAAVALLAACEAKLPTAGEIERLDVAGVESRTRLVATEMDNAEFVVDGRTVTAEEARGIAPERIAAIQVQKKVHNGEESAQVRIVTREAAESGAVEVPRGEPGADRVRIRIQGEGAGEALEKGLHGEGPVRLRLGGPGEQPLVFVDGVRSNAGAMREMDAGRIEKVEVIKGPEAVRRFGAEAAAGVVRITTKR